MTLVGGQERGFRPQTQHAGLWLWFGALNPSAGACPLPHTKPDPQVGRTEVEEAVAALDSDRRLAEVRARPPIPLLFPLLSVPLTNCVLTFHLRCAALPLVGRPPTEQHSRRAFLEAPPPDRCTRGPQAFVRCRWAALEGLLDAGAPEVLLSLVANLPPERWCG